MKIAIAVAATMFISGPALAHQAPNVQWRCHTLASSGNYVAPDEQIINGMACKAIVPSVAQAPVVAENVKSQADQVVAPKGQPTPTAAAVAEDAPGATEAVSTRIAGGATVYIEPMNGFENYLTAALLKKKVDLTVVTNRDQAQYVIAGTADQKKAGWAKMAFTGNIHSDDAASVTMSDRRTGAVVFAYAVDKKNTMHGQQTTAEACAKHLEEKIKSEK